MFLDCVGHNEVSNTVEHRLLDTSRHFSSMYFPIVRHLLDTSTLLVRHFVVSNTVSQHALDTLKCLTTVLYPPQWPLATC
jgi:hypothetical protein